MVTLPEPEPGTECPTDNLNCFGYTGGTPMFGCTLRLSVLNEVHTNSSTDPRLFGFTSFFSDICHVAQGLNKRKGSLLNSSIIKFGTWPFQF